MELSETLNILPKYISQAINQNLNQNFYDFVNSFRIEEAKQLLKSDELRINEIMDQVGYKNRSSFNTIFKTNCGCTPSEFRKQFNNTK